MKKFFVVFALLASFNAVADEFEGGASEFKFTRYSDEHIQMEIARTAKMACKKDRCRLFSTTSDSKAFVVEFNSGYGAMNGGMGGYGGYGGNGGGGTVVIGGGGYNAQPQPYVGMSLRYVKGDCTQDVQVPESLYIAMNTYIYHLMTEEGEIRKNISPAEQTMLMLYTTLINQAKGCTPVTR